MLEQRERDAIERQVQQADEHLSAARETRERVTRLTSIAEMLDEGTTAILAGRMDERLWRYRRERAITLLRLGVGEETRERIRMLYGV